MIAAIPADPVKAAARPARDPGERSRACAPHYCLDAGFVGQYGCYVDRVVHGDLGESYRSKRAVAAIIASRVWPTAQLALAAILLQLAIGVPLGVIAAIRRNRWPDHAANVFGLIGQSAPTFFIGTLLLYVFAYRLRLVSDRRLRRRACSSRLHHLVLPAATLATVGVAYYARVVRSRDGRRARRGLRAHRARQGRRERRVVVRHALRNALGPLVTLVGLDLGVLLGGAVVTEYIFAWPGLGREVLQAILEVDIPLDPRRRAGLRDRDRGREPARRHGVRVDRSARAAGVTWSSPWSPGCWGR